MGYPDDISIKAVVSVCGIPQERCLKYKDLDEEDDDIPDFDRPCVIIMENWDILRRSSAIKLLAETRIVFWAQETTKS